MLRQSQRRKGKLKRIPKKPCIDYLAERTKRQENERRIQEENELLRMEQDNLKTTLQNVMSKAETDLKQTSTAAERKTEEVAQKYRKQVQLQSENLLIIQVLFFGQWNILSRNQDLNKT